MGSTVQRTNPASERQAAHHPPRRGNLHHKMAEHDAPEWQAAMEALLLVAERGGPTMLARIGVMQALNRHVVPVFESSGRKRIGESESWHGIGDRSPIPLYANPLISIRIVAITAYGQSKSKFQTCAH